MTEKHHCSELLGKLCDYIDGEASDALCAQIEEHLAECPNCRIFVDTMRKTISLYRQRDEECELPEDVKQRLYRRLHLEPWLSSASPEGE